MTRTIRWTGLALLLAGCGGESSSEPPMAVVATSADGANERGQALFYLNHPLRIDFSRPLDPLSVSGDTVRVIDQNGHAVPGSIRIGTRSVTFEPQPPLTATLDDGSFKPEQIYRLEIAGFPRANAVRASDGQVLDRTCTRAFRTMGTNAAEIGLPSPLLPVQRGEERFELRAELLPGLRMAAATRKLLLHFTLPVLPPTAKPSAFRIRRQSDPSEPIEPSEVRALSRPEPLDPYPGCTLELRFADDLQLEPNDVVYVLFETGDSALRDYRGRPIEVPTRLGGYVRVPVDAGSRKSLLQVRAGPQGPALHAADPSRLGFMVAQDRILPAVHIETGSGRHGRFAPSRDVLLARGVPFDRGDGVEMVCEDGRFDFHSIRIPSGVRVEVRAAADAPVWLRSLESVRIEGVLRLVVAGQGASPPGPGDQVPLQRLLDSAVVAITAGGDLRVLGAVEADRAEGAESLLTLLTAGQLELRGPIPARSVLGVPPGSRVQGTAVDPIPVEVTLTPGLADGARGAAEAWTQWYRVPLDRQESVEVVLHGCDPGLAVAVQVAPPDPLDTARPFLDPAAAARPVALPMSGDLVVPRGGFLRLLLRCELGDGPLPGLAGFSVYAR